MAMTNDEFKATIEYLYYAMTNGTATEEEWVLIRQLMGPLEKFLTEYNNRKPQRKQPDCD